MHLLDSISTLDPVSTAPRPRARAPRPRNRERAAVTSPAALGAAAERRPRRGDLCGGRRPCAVRRPPARSGRRGEPVFAGCLRQRLALNAADSCATLARLREDAGALARRRASFRWRRDEPGRSAASPVPALRLTARPRRRGGPAAELLGLPETIDASALAATAAAAPDPLMAAARASAAAVRLCPQPPTPKSSPSWSPISLWQAV